MSKLGSETLLGQRADQWLGELTAARRSAFTISAYQTDLDNVADHLAAHLNMPPAELDISDLTRANLVAAFETFSVDHSPATIRRTMATLGSFCRYLVNVTEELPRNPVQTIRRPEMPFRPRRLIDDDDYPRKIMDAAASDIDRAKSRWPIRDAALMASYLLLGLRCSEAIGIRPRDIASSEDTPTVLIRGKRSNERVLIVPPLLSDFWATYMAEAVNRFGPLDPSTPMFRNATTGQPLTRHAAANLVDRIYRQAGIRAKVPPGSLVHTLRHGYATEAAYAGVLLTDLRDHLGHSTIGMTNLYLHSDPRRRRDLVENHPFVEQVRRAGTV